MQKARLLTSVCPFVFYQLSIEVIAPPRLGDCYSLAEPLDRVTWPPIWRLPDRQSLQDQPGLVVFLHFGNYIAMLHVIGRMLGKLVDYSVSAT